jgi:hypothetical protein
MLVSSLAKSEVLTTSSTYTYLRVIRLFVLVTSPLTSRVLILLSTINTTTKIMTISRSTSRSTTLSLQGVSIIPMLKSHRYRRRRRLCLTFKISISSILVYRSLVIATPYLQILTPLLLRNEYRQLSRN